MGLDQVVQEILEEGRQEAQAIREDAEQEAQAILEDAREEADREAEKIRQQARQDAESKARRIKASAQLDGKKKRLNAQSDVLSSIRARVEDRIRDLDADQRAKLLETLVESSGAHELGKGASARGRPEDQETIEALGFTYDGEIECLGGAVIESPDGTVSEDLRFETILDRVWRSSIHDIADKHLEH